MLVNVGGRERTRKDFEDVCLRAGLSLTSVTPLTEAAPFSLNEAVDARQEVDDTDHGRDDAAGAAAARPVRGHHFGGLEACSSPPAVITLEHRSRSASTWRDIVRVG